MVCAPTWMMVSRPKKTWRALHNPECKDIFPGERERWRGARDVFARPTAADSCSLTLYHLVCYSGTRYLQYCYCTNYRVQPTVNIPVKILMTRFFNGVSHDPEVHDQLDCYLVYEHVYYDHVLLILPRGGLNAVTLTSPAPLLHTCVRIQNQDGKK